MQVENTHQDWAIIKEQKAFFTPFGDSQVAYATCHGIVAEGFCFASLEEMKAELFVEETA